MLAVLFEGKFENLYPSLCSADASIRLHRLRLIFAYVPIVQLTGTSKQLIRSLLRAEPPLEPFSFIAQLYFRSSLYHAHASRLPPRREVLEERILCLVHSAYDSVFHETRTPAWNFA